MLPYIHRMESNGSLAVHLSMAKQILSKLISETIISWFTSIIGLHALI